MMQNNEEIVNAWKLWMLSEPYTRFGVGNVKDHVDPL